MSEKAVTAIRAETKDTSQTGNMAGHRMERRGRWISARKETASRAREATPAPGRRITAVSAAVSRAGEQAGASLNPAKVQAGAGLNSVKDMTKAEYRIIMNLLRPESTMMAIIHEKAELSPGKISIEILKTEMIEISNQMHKTGS